MKYLDPKSDVTFKKVFGEHKDLLISFLNAMLPLREENYIVTLEYLSPELVPINPDKKDTIVDVRCKDKDGRQFIVEMQMYWTNAFKKRALLNTCKAYSMPAEKGGKYTELKPVYTLSLVNDIAFPELDEFYHCYKLTHTQNTTYTIDDIMMIFVELPKFSPKSYNEKKMQVLWLRYLTEINERTQHVDEELIGDANVCKALSLVEESAYTDDELYAIDHYWDAVSRERTVLAEKYERGHAEGLEEGIEIGVAKGRAKGHAEGLEEGLAKGEKKRSAEIAKTMLSMNIPLETISKASGLSKDELLNI